MAKKTKSEAQKRYFASYNPEKQREKRLQRHLKNHPNDAQASNGSRGSRRVKPQNKGGWLTRQMASVIYLGKLPGKDDDAINIMNSMKPVDKVQMAKFSRFVKKVRARSQYEKDSKSSKLNKLGYAG